MARTGGESSPVMYGEEKSDSLIVAAKQANNPERSQWSEGAGPRERGTTHAPDTEPESMSQSCHACELRKRKKERFTALFHLLTVEALEAAFLSLSRKAAAGVDGIRWMDRRNMKNNITDLHRSIRAATGRSPAGVTTSRMENNARSASPRWRTQYALVKILNAVYETMGFIRVQTRAKPARCTGRTGHRYALT
jgi:hypothetical protein